MQLGDVLRQARLEKGLTQVQVADRLTISQAYYNRIEAAKIKPPSFYIIDKLAIILNIDRNKLVKLAEKASIEYRQNQLDNERKMLGIKSDLAKSRPIPILSEVPNSIPDNPEDFPSEIITGFYDSTVKDPKAFMYEVEGDFMTPEIKKGDLLLIYPSEIDKVKSGDIVVIRNSKGTKRLRRVVLEHDQIILIPDNSDYPVIIWKKERDEPVIIGRVKEIIRRR